MKKSESNTILTNRRAKFEYELLDTFTTGIVLHGHEVKSLRYGGGDLKGAYVTLKDNEAWLTNAHIKAYAFANNVADYDPNRSRKLLLSKRELAALTSARDEKKTIIPLRIFKAGKYIKLTIAIARGKKLYDKRSSIKQHDISRDIDREISSRTRNKH